MVNIDVKPLETFTNKIKNIVNTNKVKKSLDNVILQYSDIVLSLVKKNFKDDNELPSSFPVDLRNDRFKIKFNLPSRLPTGNIRNRTGYLRSSFFTRTNKKKNSIDVKIGNFSPYAFIQENGGVIRPKHSHYLSIPIDKDSYGKSPLEFTDTFVYKDIIMQRLTKHFAKPKFLLKKSVRLKGQHYFEYGLKDSKNKLAELIKDSIGKIFD